MLSKTDNKSNSNVFIRCILLLLTILTTTKGRSHHGHGYHHHCCYTNNNASRSMTRRRRPTEYSTLTLATLPQSNPPTTSLKPTPASMLDSMTILFSPFFSSMRKFDENIRNNNNLVKNELIEQCFSNYGKNSPAIRAKIESSIDKLCALSNNNNLCTTMATNSSPLLQRKWIVLWTSEKEINFFLEYGISSEIYQTLSEGERLINSIPFDKIGDGNSGFHVTGRTSIDNADDERRLRTKFKFETTALNLGRWGTYTFPPLGEGWFDTVYLDNDLRIDINSRNDILICRAGKVD